MGERVRRLEIDVAREGVRDPVYLRGAQALERCGFSGQKRVPDGTLACQRQQRSGPPQEGGCGRRVQLRAAATADRGDGGSRTLNAGLNDYAPGDEGEARRQAD